MSAVSSKKKAKSGGSAAAEEVKTKAKKTAEKPSSTPAMATPAKKASQAPAKEPDKAPAKASGAKDIVSLSQKTVDAMKVARDAELAALPPAARTMFLKEFEPAVRQTFQAAVKHWWTIGSYLDKALSDEGKYGKRVIETFASLSQLSPYHLRSCVAVYRCWPDLGSLEKLQAAAKQVDYNLSITHLWTLAAVHKPASRVRLLQMAISEKLSVEALGELVKKEVSVADDRKRPAGPGRPVSIPPTPAAGISRLGKEVKGLVDYLPVFRDHVLEKLTADVEIDEKMTESLREVEARALEAVNDLQNLVDLIEARLTGEGDLDDEQVDQEIAKSLAEDEAADDETEEEDVDIDVDEDDDDDDDDDDSQDD